MEKNSKCPACGAKCRKAHQMKEWKLGRHWCRTCKIYFQPTEVEDGIDCTPGPATTEPPQVCSTPLAEQLTCGHPGCNRAVLKDCTLCAAHSHLGAVKRDVDKLRYDLLPAFPLEELVKVLSFGARKYSDRNWEQGFKYSRVFAALLRHVWAFWSGETHDPETGLHHLAHAACNCFFLIEFSKTGKGEDDRPCKLK